MSFTIAAPVADAIVRRDHSLKIEVKVHPNASDDDLALAGTYGLVIAAPPAYGEHLIKDAALSVFHGNYGIDNVDDVGIEVGIVPKLPRSGIIGLGRHDIDRDESSPSESNFMAPASCVVVPPGGPAQTIFFDAEPWLQHVGPTKAATMVDAAAAEAGRREMVEWLVDNGHERLWQASFYGATFIAVDLPAQSVTDWLNPSESWTENTPNP